MPVASGSRFVDTIWHDLRYAVRTLSKNWGFTALAITSLGIGLGANTALFSLVDALLLRSLPVTDPARLVLVQRTAANGKAVPIEAGSLDVIRGLTTIYGDAGLSTALPAATVTIDHQPEPARQVFRVTPGFFSTLGVEAEVGRLHDAEPVAVISDRFWTSRFQRDRNVVGRRIVVNDDAYAIAGIAAPGFLGVSLDSAGDIWLAQPQFRGAAVSANRATRARRLDCTSRGRDRRAAQRRRSRRGSRPDPDVRAAGRAGHVESPRAVPRAIARADGPRRPPAADDLRQSRQSARRPQRESRPRAERADGAGRRPFPPGPAVAH